MKWVEFDLQGRSLPYIFGSNISYLSVQSAESITTKTSNAYGSLSSVTSTQ